MLHERGVHVTSLLCLAGVVTERQVLKKYEPSESELRRASEAQRAARRAAQGGASR